MKVNKELSNEEKQLLESIKYDKEKLVTYEKYIRNLQEQLQQEFARRDENNSKNER